MQKLLSLIWPHLFLFLFLLLWKMDPKRYCCDLCEECLPMLSSKSFIVPSVTFRSLVHFEFIFVYAVKQCSNFFFFKCYCPVLPAPFIYCLFSIVCSCLFCCRLTIGQSVCRFSRLVVSDSLQPHEIYISGFPAHHQLLARRYIGLFLGCLSVT